MSNDQYPIPLLPPLQRFERFPAVFVEGHPIVVDEGNPLAPEALLHDGGRFEVALAGEAAVAVDDAVAGKAGADRRVQGPAHHPRSAAAAQVLGDIAVGGDAAGRNLGDDVPDAFVEVGRSRAGFRLCISHLFAFVP